MNQRSTAADFFRAVLTDPQAAIDLLQCFDETEGDFLRIVACQQAIFSGFPSVPTTRQIREFTTMMRRLYDEEINTFAVATLISSCFNPKSESIAERIKDIPSDQRQRTMIFIPHAVYVQTRLTPDLVDLWVRRCLAHLDAGRAKSLSDFGTDVGGFYRVVLTDVEEALAMLKDVEPARWAAMILNVAVGALYYLFHTESSREDTRQQLLDFLRTEHDITDDDIVIVDELISYAFGEDTITPTTDTRRLCTIGILLPRVMMMLLRPSALTIIDFIKDCKSADDAMAEHLTGP